MPPSRQAQRIAQRQRRARAARIDQQLQRADVPAQQRRQIQQRMTGTDVSRVERGVSRSQLRQQAASRVEGLGEDDIRVERRDDKLVAEPETEALAEQVREDVRQRENVDVEDSISVTVRRGEEGEIRTRAEVTPAESEQELTADTPTGRTIEKALDPITEPLSRGAQELAEKIRETPLPTTRPEAALLNTKLQNDDPGPISRVASGGVEAVGDAARLPEAAIRVSEDAAAISGPALRAGTPIEPGDAGPTEEALETAQQEAEDVPGQVRTAAVRTGEFAAENPLRFAGQLAVGAAVGGAATRGLSRAGVPVERIPSAGEVTGRATRRVTGKATRAASDAVERASPVVRRELEAAGVDVDRFTPLRRQTQTVGTVSRPATGFTRIRELKRAGPDTPESATVEPDITVPAGEPGPFGRTVQPRVQTTLQGFDGGGTPDISRAELEGQREVVGDPTQRAGKTEEVVTGTQQQTTLDAGLEDVEVTETTRAPTDPVPEAQAEAFLARPVRGFREETRRVEDGDADITTRGDVGTRAEVGRDDFGGGEGATVEAQTGQTGVPAAALELEKPGLLGRVLGRDTDLRVRGEVPDEATQAAVGRILAEYRRRTDTGAEGRTVDEIELGEAPADEVTPTVDESDIEAESPYFESEAQEGQTPAEVFAEEARREAQQKAEQLPFDFEEVLFRSEVRRPRGEISEVEATSDRPGLFASPGFRDLGFDVQTGVSVGDILPSGLSGLLRGDVRLPTSLSRRRRQVVAIEPRGIEPLEEGKRPDVTERGELAEPLQEADEGVAFTTERGLSLREREALLPPGTTLKKVGEFEVETEDFGTVPGEALRVVEEGETRAEGRVRGERAQAQLLGGEGRTVETSPTGASPEAAAREAITESDAGEFTDRGRLADVTEFDDGDTAARTPSDVGAEAGGLTPAAEGEVTPPTEGESAETTTVKTEIRPETPSEVGETAVIGDGEPAEINPLGEFTSRERDVIQAERPSERDDGARPAPLTGVVEDTAVTPAVESSVRTATDTVTEAKTSQDTRVTAAPAETTSEKGALRFTGLRTPPEREFVPGDDDEDELFLDGDDEDGPGGITEQQFLADLAGPGEVLRGDAERQELDEDDAGFVFGG